jgi:hypothetical protein
MMPEGYADRLAELERREQAGTLGLTEAQRQGMEQSASVARGGALADAQARQLQQAQMLSGQGAVSGRDLFLGELATQQAQAQMLTQQAQQIQAANERERLRQQQQLLELQQREASAAAARRSAGATLTADLLGTAATAGIGIGGAQAMQGAQTSYLEALAGGNQAGASSALVQMQNAQAAMQMVGAFGGGAPLPAMPPSQWPVEYEELEAPAPTQMRTPYDVRGMV